MNKHFIANKYLPIALALAAFIAAGTAPVLAQQSWGAGISTRNGNRSTTVAIAPTRGLLITARSHRLVLGAQTRSGRMNGLTDKGPSNQPAQCGDMSGVKESGKCLTHVPQVDPDRPRTFPSQ